MSPFHATLKLTQTIFEYLEKIQIEIFFEFVSRYNLNLEGDFIGMMLEL